MKILELKSSIAEMKSSREWFNKRFKIQKEIITEFVYKEIKIIQSEEQTEKTVEKWMTSQRPMGHQTYHIHKMRAPDTKDKGR